MEKKDMIKDYSVYELSKEEVTYAVKLYLTEELNSFLGDDSIVEIREDGSANVIAIWADKEKDK